MTATQTRTGYRTFAESRTAQRPAVTTGRLRVTRRGRLLLTAVVALLLLVVLSIGRAGSQAATVTEAGPGLQQATVQAGDTLWSVAQRIAPDNDPREVVAQIRRINDLSTSGLQVGQQLLLPTLAG